MKKAATLFFSFLFILFCLPVPASAEGFVYEFDPAGGGPHCESILMLNMDTDTIVYSMNPDEQRAMASLTKIMSYIVTVEAIPDLKNTVVTVPQAVADELADTGSSLADIEVGEEFTAYQLLHLMMIPSGNDAALTLAKYIDNLHITVGQLDGAMAEGEGEIPEESEASGLTEAEDPRRVLSFVDMMNRKAEELGCRQTRFQNPHGLHAEGHYSTARDLMAISQYAMTLPHFTEITSMTYYDLAPTNKSPQERTVYNTNMLMQQYETSYYYQYVTGIKTGSLDESGYCISASATYEGYTYIIIAMGSPYRDEEGNKIDTHGEMLDCKELFRWAFTNLQIKTIAENGDLMGDVAMRFTWNQDRLQVVAGENIRAVLPGTVEASSVIPILDLPDTVDAPVKKGDVLGTATLTYADQTVGTVKLVAAESVERSEMMKTLEQGRAILSSTWFQIVLLAIIALVVIYIVLMVIYRRRRRRKRKQKYSKRYNKRNM